MDWKRWQTERPTEAQVREWWACWPEAQVGVVTGQVSGLVVLDCDTAETLETVTARCGGVLPSTPMVKTPRGWHLYFRHPGGEAIPTRALEPKLDCKADGGCVVAPPSVNGSGQCYAWQIGLDVPLAPLPGWVREGMAVSTEPFSLPARLPDGERNSDLYRLARSLHAKGLTEDEIRAAVESVNRSRCVSPLPASEVAEIAAKAAHQPDREDFVTPLGRPEDVKDSAFLVVPSDCLLGLGREFAECYADYLEPPVSFFYFAFAAYFGASIAKMVTLDSELHPEPRIYLILLGESGDDHKSTAIVKADEFFRSLGSAYALPTLYGVGSAEGLAHELADSSTLVLHCDELKAFIEKAKIQNSVMLPMVGTLFERAEYDNRTKSSRIKIRGASFVLVAASTKDTYANLFDRQSHDIGFLNRLWLVVDRSTPRYPIPRPIPSGRVDALLDRVRARLDAIRAAWQANGMRPVAYPLTQEATDIFSAWYGRREPSLFTKRLDIYGHRWMLLYAAMTGRSSVDREIAQATVRLLEYQLAARRESDPIDAETMIAGIEEKIRRVATGRGRLSESDLKRRCHYSRYGLWAWNTAIGNLRDAGELEREGAWVRLLENRPAPLSAPAHTKLGTSQHD